jgi:very-short-patch-repair endonuclease
MARKALLTDDDKQEIVKRYAEGAGLVELAREYHCRFDQVKAILKVAEAPRRKLKTANTPIECRLHDALMAAGIGFTTQRRLVGRYVVDIAIHQAPIVIEADGMQHHAGTAAQKRDAIRDAAHEAAGYRVFRFSGSEINTDAVKCIQEVVNACGLVPDKEPVYDIRTKFSGQDHPRWRDGMPETACEWCGEKFRGKGRGNRRFCSPEHYALAGKPRSAEHRAKIAAANRLRVQTPEARAKIAASRRGKPTTAGIPKSAETRAKISASLMGHQDSEETRAKKSAGHTGKKMDPETRAKIAAALRGKPKSAEHRANLSASKRSSQIMIESELARECKSSPETGLPATLF